MRARELLFEAMSKGAKNVLANKALVANLASAIRDDHTIPKDIRRARNMSDLDLATWFVEQLDSIEANGHLGIRVGQNGQYHMWAATNYSQGKDIWEDLSGSMASALMSFNTLRNRTYPADYPDEKKAGKPLLDPLHQEIGKFRGVKELSRYMTQHYNDILEDITKKAKEQAAEKWYRVNARSVKLADEPEYTLYLLQNWGAAFQHGKGTAFCTFNSRNDAQFQDYSKNGPIFGIVPKILPRIEKGRKNTGTNLIQKFQFDTGTGSFMDYVDEPADPKFIHENFPYLLDDLVKGLIAHQAEIEKPSEEKVQGQGPQPDKYYRIETPTKNGDPLQKKSYNVSNVIAQLKSKFARYWTDKKRPKPTAEQPPNPETAPASPQTPPPTA